MKVLQFRNWFFFLWSKMCVSDANANDEREWAFAYSAARPRILHNSYINWETGKRRAQQQQQQHKPHVCWSCLNFDVTLLCMTANSQSTVYQMRINKINAKFVRWHHTVTEHSSNGLVPSLYLCHPVVYIGATDSHQQTSVGQIW